MDLTSSEARERIARAICRAIGDDWDREGPDGLTDHYGEIADAALAEVAAMLKEE